MLHAEHELLHRHPAFADDPGRVPQDQPGHQPQDEVAVVGILALDLAGVGGQQRLHGAKTLLNPAPPTPGPEQPRGAHRRRPAEQVVPVAPWWGHHDYRAPAIRGAGGGQPGLAPPRHLRALPPRPVRPGQHILSLDLPALGQVEDLGGLALDHQEPLLARGEMPHQARIPTPTIGED